MPTTECPTHGHAPSTNGACAICQNLANAADDARGNMRRTVTARCGRADSHGAHQTQTRPYWCAGNRGVIVEVSR